jgi:hypothetical protein
MNKSKRLFLVACVVALAVVGAAEDFEHELKMLFCSS